MTSSRWSKLAAVLVFSLIAFVVLSGMTWATVATFKLAKVNVREKQRTRTLQAVNLMDSYVGGILNSESARTYTDYVAFYPPPAIWSLEGARLPCRPYLLRSPLMKPPHRWIDLYFHVEAGRWSSPQIPDEAAPWMVECVMSSELQRRRLRNELEWLSTALPAEDLHDRVVKALERERSFAESPRPTPPRPANDAADENQAGRRRSGQLVSTEFRKRKRGHRETQLSYLPDEQCVPRYHGDTANVATANAQEANGVEPTSDGEGVGLSCEEFAPPFWLEAPHGGGLKMAFVRECYEDAAVRHQGFVGDWGQLEPQLLQLVDHLFPKAKLEPIRNDAQRTEADSESKMSNLPVRLEVPGVPGGASAAAWRSIRGYLIASWATAAAVLVVAGLGLRNLVALTERRMQFAYAVTHELRTPLTTFRLYSDMLSAGLVPEKSKQEYLDTLNHESLRLASLVEGVLEYARLENQKIKLNPTATQGATLLDTIAETLEKGCKENDIEARTENALSNGQSFYTDVDVVNRIVGVLVNNACRYARGAADAVILLRLSGHDGKVYFDIVDSGPGVDRADARAIFKPFRRGHNADGAAHGGIGLGLALAGNWAHLLGGRLELAARHDPQLGGAHFRLTIPTKPDASPS